MIVLRAVSAFLLGQGGSVVAPASPRLGSTSVIVILATAQPVAPSLRPGPRRHFHLSSEISGATSSHAELCPISNLIGS